MLMFGKSRVHYYLYKKGIYPALCMRLCSTSTIFQCYDFYVKPDFGCTGPMCRWAMYSH